MNVTLTGWPFTLLATIEPDGPPGDPGSGSGTPL